MTATLRILRLFALITWLGGLLFFAFVVAPTAFSPAIVERTHSLALSGTVVAGCLSNLHIIGIICGAVLIVTTLLLAGGRRTSWIAVIAGGMIALTAYSQYSIMPRMESARMTAGGDIEPGCTSEPCNHFQRLHHSSEHVEGAVMLGGLVIAVLLAIE